jgi:hypothetical protein
VTGIASRYATDYRKTPWANAGDVRKAYRIAIHRGIVE